MDVRISLTFGNRVEIGYAKKNDQLLVLIAVLSISWGFRPRKQSSKAFCTKTGPRMACKLV